MWVYAHKGRAEKEEEGVHRKTSNKGAWTSVASKEKFALKTEDLCKVIYKEF